MLRTIIFHILPFLVPFIVYGVYLHYLKRAGGEKTWQGKSLAITTMIGLIFVAASFVALWIFQDRAEDGDYIPPRFENGKLIEGQIVPRNPD